MHEASLATQVLDAVLDRAGTAVAQRVPAVHGWIAENEVRSPQSLCFHSAHARGTLAEGAKLELRLIHVEARCRACTTKYPPTTTCSCVPPAGAPMARCWAEAWGSSPPPDALQRTVFALHAWPALSHSVNVRRAT